MERIQIVLDKALLQATDRAARRTRQNRSAFVRDALRGHIRMLATLEMEERDREGYARQPQDLDESRYWETEGSVTLGL